MTKCTYSTMITQTHIYTKYVYFCKARFTSNSVNVMLLCSSSQHKLIKTGECHIPFLPLWKNDTSILRPKITCNFFYVFLILCLTGHWRPFLATAQVAEAMKARRSNQPMTLQNNEKVKVALHIAVLLPALHTASKREKLTLYSYFLLQKYTAGCPAKPEQAK